jgi:hypothetical protein
VGDALYGDKSIQSIQKQFQKLWIVILGPVPQQQAAGIETIVLDEKRTPFTPFPLSSAAWNYVCLLRLQRVLLIHNSGFRLSSIPAAAMNVPIPVL